MSIKIGDNNKIKNSSIGHQHNTSGGDANKKFYERHSWISGMIVSLIVGIIMLFPLY
ncbi:hypothetical protein [Bacillus cereus]|uniref:hypothetical protein n=1 Tax=Bacillus cereus TaxID=1396 RepID=UPI0037F6E939